MNDIQHNLCDPNIRIELIKMGIPEHTVGKVHQIEQGNKIIDGNVLWEKKEE